MWLLCFQNDEVWIVSREQVFLWAVADGKTFQLGWEKVWNTFQCGHKPLLVLHWTRFHLHWVNWLIANWVAEIPDGEELNFDCSSGPYPKTWPRPSGALTIKWIFPPAGSLLPCLVQFSWTLTPWWISCASAREFFFHGMLGIAFPGASSVFNLQVCIFRTIYD